jgi:serine/threonine protein kinase
MSNPRIEKIIKIKNNNYKLIKKLGEGGFGIVYEVENIDSNEKFALKKYRLACEQKNGIPPDILREISCYKKFRDDNENIVKLFSIDCSNHNISLLLEYCEMNLFTFIKDKKNFSDLYNERIIKDIFKQIVKGIYFIHKKKIIQRDLKPSNILLKIKNDNNYIVKIIDFGLSRKYSLPNERYSANFGTLNYKPPEILLGSDVYNITVDSWGLGCILTELIIGKTLFKGTTEIEVLNNMFNIFGTFDEKQLPGMIFFKNFKPTFIKQNGIGLINFLKNNVLFEVDESCFQLISNLLELDPTKRILSKEILKCKWFQI